jgi:hypothetical protein
MSGNDGAVNPPISAADARLLDTLRQMWEERDPMPADLVERVSFALSLEDLDVELLRLTDELLAPVGARAEERARTVTFSSDTLSVMITINDGHAGTVRLDGWIGDGGGLSVGLRSAGEERLTLADEDGRFSFDSVRSGLAQLVFHPTEGAEIELRQAVVTPAIQV